MKISMIVAYGKNWEIGLENQMPWHISEDFKNFKAITSGHHLLMGRKTFESIGRPLPNRTSLVLSRGDFSYEHESVFTFDKPEEAFDFARENQEDELFIVGGANIYNTLFDYIDKMYLSEVDYEGKADAYLKPIDFSAWELVEEKNHEPVYDESGVVKSPAWSFKVWAKKR